MGGPGWGLDENGFLPPLPQPVTGCAECQRLARERQKARAVHDMSLVTDVNVFMRRHHQAVH